MNECSKKWILFPAAIAAAVMATSCTATETDTKRKSLRGATKNTRLSDVENKAGVSSAPAPEVEKRADTLVLRMPEADWLKKDETRTKIWEYTPSPWNPDRHASSMSSPLEYRFTEVEISNSSLFLYVQHKVRRPSEETAKRKGMREAPTMEMYVDGCSRAAQSPRSAGVVEFDGKEPSLIVIPRMDLPEGDIELWVSAFGATHHIILLNYEDGLKVMTSKKQSRWYRESVLSDGSKGFTMAYPKRPGCPPEDIEEKE